MSNLIIVNDKPRPHPKLNLLGDQSPTFQLNSFLLTFPFVSIYSQKPSCQRSRARLGWILSDLGLRAVGWRLDLLRQRKESLLSAVLR